MFTMLSCTGGSEELVWLQPTIFWHVSIRQCLHVGQDECELSHLSIHRTWNPWLHLGRRRTRSPGVNSERHIAHSVSNPAEELSADLEATKLEHLNAHLMMEFNPSEQIRAHRRTERTITTFASKLLLPV